MAPSIKVAQPIVTAMQTCRPGVWGFSWRFSHATMFGSRVGSRGGNGTGLQVKGWTLLLATVCVVALLSSMAILAWNAEGFTADGMRGEAIWAGHAAFPSGVWRAAVVATGAVAGISLVVSLVAAGLRIQDRDRAPTFAKLSAAGTRDAIEQVRQRLQTCVAGSSPHIVGAVDELVRGAVAVHASDIHISPTPQGVRATYRVHGTLHEVAQLDAGLSAPLSTRIKVLARLDTHVHGVPQDGRLVLSLEGKSIEARVSTLPTEGGERVVLRLVRGSVAVPDLVALGLPAEVVTGLVEVLAKPQGLLFVTGPVGSGKTTTLYAAMKHIHSTRGAMTTMVTLEDPIELELPFATQTQMKPKAGITFAGTLRSVLRQDPNVLMLGEIRDHESADISAQAGLTGHLILTTIHGEGAAGPFARLMEMQVEPFVVASASLACLSQRLVRVLCTACRREVEPEPIHRERFRSMGVELPEGPYCEPVGCEYCEGQGFTGRTPLAELLRVTPELREAVNRRATTGELYDLAVSQGMRPLILDGLDRARLGATSLTEVLRVAG